MFHEIHYDQTGIDTGKYLKLLGQVSRHVNNQAYEVPFAFTDYYKFSYFPRTINEWNILPNETVNASSLMAFTNYLFLIYNIIYYFYLILFIYLFIDRWPICKNDQLCDGGKVMVDMNPDIKI